MDTLKRTNPDSGLFSSQKIRQRIEARIWLLIGNTTLKK